MLFDQVRFQNERLRFAVGVKGVNVTDFRDELIGLRHCLCFAKIRLHPFAQADSFADINDLSVGIFHQVHAAG